MSPKFVSPKLVSPNPVSPNSVVPQPISRRRFLKVGCLTGAAVGLTICGATALAPDPPPVEYSAYTYGEVTMNNRILIAYATYAGSTSEVAATIGETLGARGLAVDVKPIQDKPQIDDYQAVLIGSAIHRGHWLPEAIDFVKANQAALQRVPVGLFCVHIQNTGSDETSRQRRLAYLDELHPLLQPIAEGFFAGRFNRRGAKLLLPGWLARLVPNIDLRNWETIRAWAASVSPLLQLA
jgi:menaquinone-dependent protoporphyrinogen oxidase